MASDLTSLKDAANVFRLRPSKGALNEDVSTLVGPSATEKDSISPSGNSFGQALIEHSETASNTAETNDRGALPGGASPSRPARRTVQQAAVSQSISSSAAANIARAYQLQDWLTTELFTWKVRAL